MTVVVPSLLFIANRKHSLPFFCCRTTSLVAALGYHDSDHYNSIGTAAADRSHHNLHCNHMHLQEA